jgi:hypothetical protein
MNIDDELKDAFDDIYQGCAHDLGAAVGASMMSREDLFSTCCDLFLHRCMSERGFVSEDCFEYWQLLSYDEKWEYAKIVFPYDFYETGYVC